MAKQTTAARAKAVEQDEAGNRDVSGPERDYMTAEAPDAPSEAVPFITRRNRPAPKAGSAPADGGAEGRDTQQDDGANRPALRRRQAGPGKPGQKKAAGRNKRGGPARKRRDGTGTPAAPQDAPARGKPAQQVGPGDSKPNPEVPEVKPVAGPAQMKRRHWGVLSSFFVLVAVPFFAAISYLFFVAEDQYHSISGFTVRSQDQGGANELLSGLVSFAGGSTASESDILYEFIQSQEMVQSVNDRIDLRQHYSRYWPRDWAFSLWPDATQEELIWYWNRMVGVSYDSNTGLIRVQVKAFEPQMAQDVNQAIVTESQTRINELNRQAREDAMRYAQADLEDAVDQLKDAREALTEFRTRTQIVDPETDIQARMGVMSSLQQQLATALVEYDLLQQTSGQNDPRLTEARQRINAIRERITAERRNFATSSTETGGVSQDYPTLIAEYERLKVDQEYAEESYFAALKALETARDEADRQSRYLATYINPTRAEQSEFPQRFILSGLIGLFALLTWSIGVLIYYSIRDRS